MLNDIYSQITDTGLSSGPLGLLKKGFYNFWMILAQVVITTSDRHDKHMKSSIGRFLYQYQRWYPIFAILHL